MLCSVAGAKVIFSPATNILDAARKVLEEIRKVTIDE